MDNASSTQRQIAPFKLTNAQNEAEQGCVPVERYASVPSPDNALALIVLLANNIVDNSPPRRRHNRDYSGRIKLACKGNTGHAFKGQSLTTIHQGINGSKQRRTHKQPETPEACEYQTQ